MTTGKTGTAKQKTKFCDMNKDQMIELMEKINRGRKDNMESRKIALNTLVGSTAVGDKVFATVSLDELQVDESYQRALQGHVKTIARDWNSTKCDPLKINFREDGNFYVWDGQHRLEAAKIRGIKYLLCDIVVGLTQGQEAELFGSQGVGLKKPDPYDIFKANVCSGEKTDTAIKKVCDAYHLLVRRTGKTAGNLSCLTLARTIFNKGEKEYFEWVLEVLGSAKWNEFPQAHSHRFVNALYEIRRNLDEENEYVQRKLVSYLEKTNPDELLLNATIEYPQFKDESKKIKLYLLDIVNGDNESANKTMVRNMNQFIA